MASGVDDVKIGILFAAKSQEAVAALKATRNEVAEVKAEVKQLENANENLAASNREVTQSLKENKISTDAAAKTIAANNAEVEKNNVRLAVQSERLRAVSKEQKAAALATAQAERQLEGYSRTVVNSEGKLRSAGVAATELGRGIADFGAGFAFGGIRGGLLGATNNLEQFANQLQYVKREAAESGRQITTFGAVVQTFKALLTSLPGIISLLGAAFFLFGDKIAAAASSLLGFNSAAKETAKLQREAQIKEQINPTSVSGVQASAGRNSRQEQIAQVMNRRLFEQTAGKLEVGLQKTLEQTASARRELIERALAPEDVDKALQLDERKAAQEQAQFQSDLRALRNEGNEELRKQAKERLKSILQNAPNPSAVESQLDSFDVESRALVDSSIAAINAGAAADAEDEGKKKKAKKAPKDNSLEDQFTLREKLLDLAEKFASSIGDAALREGELIKIERQRLLLQQEREVFRAEERAKEDKFSKDRFAERLAQIAQLKAIQAAERDLFEVQNRTTGKGSAGGFDLRLGVNALSQVEPLDKVDTTEVDGRIKSARAQEDAETTKREQQQAKLRQQAFSVVERPFEDFFASLLSGQEAFNEESLRLERERLAAERDELLASIAEKQAIVEGDLSRGLITREEALARQRDAEKAGQTKLEELKRKEVEIERQAQKNRSVTLAKAVAANVGNIAIEFAAQQALNAIKVIPFPASLIVAAGIGAAAGVLKGLLMSLVQEPSFAGGTGNLGSALDASGGAIAGKPMRFFRAGDGGKFSPSGDQTEFILRSDQLRKVISQSLDMQVLKNASMLTSALTSGMVTRESMPIVVQSQISIQEETDSTVKVSGQELDILMERQRRSDEASLA